MKGCSSTIAVQFFPTRVGGGKLVFQLSEPHLLGGDLLTRTFVEAALSQSLV